MIRSPAILVDTTRCTGCEECVDACKQVNDLGADRLRPGQEGVDGLSSTRFTTILRRPGDHFVKQQCRHCLEPTCVSVCLVGAMQKTPEGPVIYDSDLCIGCRYCLTACPYGIPRYEWDESVPYVRKCTLCAPRVEAGQEPACTAAGTNQITPVWASKNSFRCSGTATIVASPSSNAYTHLCAIQTSPN